MHDAFHISSTPVVSDIKERVESVLLHGNKLYIGCQTGTLHIYTLNDNDDTQSSTTASEVAGASKGASAKLDKVLKGFSKRSIEQLGIIKETNSLVSLSEGTIYLHDLRSYQQQTVLGSSSQTKGQANLFSINTSIQTSGQLPSKTDTPTKGKGKEIPIHHSVVADLKKRRDGAATSSKRKAGRTADDHLDPEQEGVPVVVTTLAAGCRRRLVLFSWRDGQWQSPKEVSLPHQVRSIAFPLPQSLFLGFSTSEYGTVTLDSSSGQPVLSDLFTPTFPSSPQSTLHSRLFGTSVSPPGSGGLPLPSLSGLGGLAAKTTGYMSLGLVGSTKVERNLVVKTKSSEVIVIKENTGVLLDTAGRASRATTTSGPGSETNTVEYLYPPEEMAACWPYLVSVLPAPMTAIGHGNLGKQQQMDPVNATPILQVHSIPTLTPTQVLHVPPLSDDTQSRPASIIDVPAPPITQTARLLSTEARGKSPMVVLVEPHPDALSTHQSQFTSNTANTMQRQTRLYLVHQNPWPQQISSLIAEGSYSEAQALLQSLPNPSHIFSDYGALSKRLKVLSSLSSFLEDKKCYDSGIDTFIEENVNPCKVVSLFPRNISGKLYVEREAIEEIWGGRTIQDYRNGVARAANTSRLERKHKTSTQTKESAAAAQDTDGLGEPSPKAASWKASPAKFRRSDTSNPKDDDTASVRASVKGKSSQTTIRGRVVDKTSLERSRDDSPTGSTRTIHRESDDTASPSSKVSVDVLMRYLPDRRQQFLQALASIPLQDRPSPSNVSPSDLVTSSTTQEELFSMPDRPLIEYTRSQLVKTAQIVETTLFKCYLYSKPGLLGPLCRIENWCIVEEVEELLLEAKKYRELLDLYNGKQMHEKALALLQRMAEEQPAETSLRERLGPTIRYLQKLGSKHLDLIFKGARWIFEQEPSDVSSEDALPPIGLEIFVGDAPEVESLPRFAVSNFLQSLETRSGQEIYKRYLEWLIDDMKEYSPEFHEKLCEIYFDELEGLLKEDASGVKKEATDHRQQEVDALFKKLLDFLKTSSQYRADRLLGRIAQRNTSDGADDREEAHQRSGRIRMFDEIKAILLGRLGQYDGALSIYVYKLGDTARAEEYCRRIYASDDNPARSTIFLTLLRVYLRPRKDQIEGPVAPGKPGTKEMAVTTDPEPMFEPALSLLATHATKFSLESVLDILPPLLTISDLSVLLQKSLRKNLVSDRHHETVRKHLMRCRQDQIDVELVELKERKVKITDSRLCPMCWKRLGQSAIAIHSPFGEVTHYNCRERWMEAKSQLQTGH